MYGMSCNRRFAKNVCGQLNCIYCMLRCFFPLVSMCVGLFITDAAITSENMGGTAQGVFQTRTNTK